MAESEIVVTDLSANAQKFLQATDASARSARMLERQLLDLIGTVNDFEKAMQSMQASGLKLDLKVDTSQLDSAESDLTALDGRDANINIDVDTAQLDTAETAIKTIDAAAPTVDVSVDDTEIKTAAAEVTDLDSEAPSIPVDVETSELATAQTMVEDLDSEAPSIPFDVDMAELNTAQKAVDDLDAETINTTVKADDTELTEIKQQLSDLKALAVIDIVMKIPDLAKSLGGLPVVSDLLTIDSTVAQVQGRLNTEIPNLRDLLTSIAGTGLTDVTGAGDAIVQVGELGRSYGDLETVVTSTLKGAEVRGIEFNQQLDEARRLVDAGLVPSIEEANNALVYLQQTGGNANKDIGGTIQEFSTTFANAGLNIDQFAKLSSEAFRVGGRNVELLGESFLTLKTNIDTAMVAVQNGEDSPLWDTIQNLGLETTAEQFANGEISGAQFAAGFAASINAKIASGEMTPSAANLATTGLFGSNAENFGVVQIREIDWSAVENAEIPDDVLAQSVDKIQDGLVPALQRAGAAIQENILDKFGGAQALLDSLKDKVNEFTDLLQNGMAIPDALEVVLEAPGLADTIRTFESAAGNLVIEFLTGVANILEGLGNLQAAQGVRGTVADLATGQLAFDIQLADDGEAVTAALQTALQRGVSTADLSGALTTGISDLIDSGDVAGANELLKTIQALPNAYATVKNSISGIEYTVPLTLTPEMTDEEVQALAEEALRQQGVSEEFLANFATTDKPVIDFVPTFDTTGAAAAVDTALTELDAQFNTAIASGDYLSALPIAQQLEGSGDLRFAGLTESIKQSLLMAMDQASAGQDWSAALQDALALEGTNDLRFTGLSESIRESANVALTEAMSTGDWETAFDLADVIGTDTLADDIKTKLEEARTTIAQSGVNTEIATTSTNLADVQSGIELANTAAANTARDGLPALTTGFDIVTKATDDTTDSIAEADDTLAIFGVTVDETMSIARDNMAAYSPEIISWLEKIRDASTAASSALGKVTPPGGTTPTGNTGGTGGSSSGSSSGTGVSGGDDGHQAEGGTFTGYSWVGENGPELAWADEAMAVWNNNTSMAFLAGTQLMSEVLSGDGGIGGNTYYDNRTYNVNTSNSNYGAAARGASDQKVANAVRGFA